MTELAIEHPMFLAAGVLLALLTLTAGRLRGLGPGYAVSHPLARIALGASTEWPETGGLAGLLALAVALAGLSASSPILTVTEEYEAEKTLNQTISVEAKPAVVVALDVSGSMQGEKLAEAKKALTRFVEKATGRVDVGLVAFSDHVEAAALPTGNVSQVLEVIDGLEANGGTMYSYGLSTVLSMLRPYRYIRVPTAIVFASDGMPGDPQVYPLLVDEARRLGIPVYTVYIGEPNPVAENLLRSIAQKTGGEHYTVRDAAKLAKLYEELATEIAEKLTIQAKTRLKTRVEHRISLAPYVAALAAATAAAALYTRQHRLGVSV